MAEPMPPASAGPAERARKGVALALRRLQEPGTQVAIAAAMGVSESTVSRLKNDHLESIALLLAHAGIKLVSTDRVCVDRDTYSAMARIAARAMADESIAQRLIWDDEG